MSTQKEIDEDLRKRGYPPLAEIDRRVRELRARGGALDFTEVLPLCPYQTYIGLREEYVPDTPADNYVVAFGFNIDDSLHIIVDQVMQSLAKGETIKLLSNRLELRDQAKQAIELALRAAQGNG